MAVGDQAAIGGAGVLYEVEPRRGGNAWRRGLRIAFRKPLGAISLVIIVVMIAFALAAPQLQRYDPARTFQNRNAAFDPNCTDLFSTCRDEFVTARLSGPSMAHWFGTDDGSRDTWARVVWGTRRSMGISVASLLIALVLGGALGVISGYYGGWFDTLLQRGLDSIQSFPPLLVLILAATTLELSVRNLVFALAFLGIAQVSRLIRGSVLALREQPFVEAARVLGATDARSMVRHILPNIVPTLIVVFTVGLPVVIIAEASLTFLGLAPPAPKGSWGEMLFAGNNAILTTAWLALFSGGAITLAVLAFNLAGDALRDVLDPRLRI
jgi:peptide/nickel transport system permease protein